jgi:hypothetical protein
LWVAPRPAAQRERDPNASTGVSDAWIARIDAATGALAWAQQFGEGARDAAHALAIDPIDGALCVIPLSEGEAVARRRAARRRDRVVGAGCGRLTRRHRRLALRRPSSEGSPGWVGTVVVARMPRRRRSRRFILGCLSTC